MSVKAYTALFVSLITASIAQADTMMLYRTIIAPATSAEAAEMSLVPEAEVVSRDGAYYIVQGWYDHFEDALPSNVSDPWNKVWRRVLPVEVPVAEAESRGFQKPELLRERAQREMSAEVSFAEPAQLLGAVRDAVVEVEAREQLPDAETDDLVALLTPHVPHMVALTENAANRDDAEFAQLWLAKTFYLQGLAESKRRLPHTTRLHERHAWPEEELAYESALAEYKRFLERFPDSERAEEAAYHIAATSYHLTYKGHHRLQVQKANEAYEWFIGQYPDSKRVPRAKLNLLGIALELARMDDEGYEEVIEMGEALLAEHPGAGEYIRSRASIIVAEAWFDGPRDYGKVINLCSEIIETFTSPISAGVIGTAHRLRGITHYITSNYEMTATDFSFVIDYYQDPAFHFGYQWRENLAQAYYWRGRAYVRLSQFQLARGDFEFVIREFPDLNEAQWSEQFLNSRLMQ